MTMDDCEIRIRPIASGNLPTVRVTGQRERDPFGGGMVKRFRIVREQ
jgi:hypothetical protein